ncbi:MAG: UDP-glucose/GDP-mannose dehydrogenase family protein [Bacteroidetes bacterium]|nr:MAG: UDP-glucose/GDP-mannose dehydrogenase family protein [Bacteroidota bacterium]
MNNSLAVIGIGKLGLCLALNLERVGYLVYGVDVDPSYVAAINNKTLATSEPEVSERLAQSSRFFASVDLSAVFPAEVTLIFLAVATPSLPDGSYDHRQLERVTDNLLARGKSPTPKHLVITCTTMPGYCDQLAAKMAPYNYSVSYNPSFIAQGSIINDLQQPDQVLIGEADQEVGDLLEQVHRRMCINQPTICRMDRLSAEITKLATNCFLTTKISFANSIGDLASQVGAQPDKILAAIGADSRIGQKYLRYGFGFGGPCFPRDNRALGVFAHSQGHPLPISEATDQVNHAHLLFQFEQYLAAYPPTAAIIFDQVTYKKGTVLLTESQQLALAVLLAKAGRKVVISDQPAVQEQVEQLYPGLFYFEHEG